MKVWVEPGQIRVNSVIGFDLGETQVLEIDCANKYPEVLIGGNEKELLVDLLPGEHTLGDLGPAGPTTVHIPVEGDTMDWKIAAEGGRYSVEVFIVHLQRSVEGEVIYSSEGLETSSHGGLD